MPDKYACLGAWNDWMNKPPLDEGWIEHDEARGRYEGLRDLFEVVSHAVSAGQSDEPRPGTP